MSTRTMSSLAQCCSGVGHDAGRSQREAIVETTTLHFLGQQPSDLLVLTRRRKGVVGGGGEGIEALADVALEAHGHVVMAVDLGRKAMDVDDVLVARRIDADRIEFLQFVADGDDHVGQVETEVDIVVTHEPHCSEGLRVVVGKDPLAVEGGGHRNTQPFSETAKAVAGSAAGCAVPGQHDRVDRLPQDGDGPPDLFRGGLVRPGNVDGQGL